MAQEIFVSSSNFSAPVMTLDSRETQKQVGIRLRPPYQKINGAYEHIFQLS